MPSTAALPAARPRIAVRRASALALMVALCAITGAGAPLAAPSAHASFSVGAVVLAHAGITEQSLPVALELSATDVARGYVDLPAAARLSIVNTSPAGFALEVLPVGSVVAAVAVDGAGGQAVFDAGGGSIVERGVRGHGIALALGFRFQLAPDALPGRYPFPVAFSVRPLAD